MAKRSRKEKTRDERLKFQLQPPYSPEAEGRLTSFLFDYASKGFVEQLSEECILQRLEQAHDLMRRHFNALNIWAIFEAKGLPNGEHDPGEYRAYFDERNAAIKHHAESLLALLEGGLLPIAISHAVIETKQLYRHPAGHASARTLERSLPKRLAELISTIPAPAKPEKQKTTRGPGQVREEGIRAVLNLWLEVDGSPPKFHRAGAGGTACGPFADFAKGIFEAVGIRAASLETVTRRAEKIYKEDQRLGASE